MEISTNLALGLVVWMTAAVSILLSRLRRRSNGSGLVFAYLLNFWAMHWVATSLYLLPWCDYKDAEIAKLGFEQGLYGVLAFALGSLVLAPLVLKVGFGRKYLNSSKPHPALPRGYLIAGAVSYLLLSSSLGTTPTASALIAVGQNLFVVGLCLSCWKAWQEKDLIRFALWSSVGFLLPFLTIVTRGFMGYGAAALVVVLLFISSFLRAYTRLLIGGLLVGYLGLSLYVSYMRDRGEIRRIVWGGQSLSDRVVRVYETIETFEWFDPHNLRHLDLIDARLDQNFLVGASVRFLSETRNYAYGRTIWDAALALVPRIVWPEKPVSAGSGRLVSEHTGFRFEASTSVGVGQVMEFYINFGSVGVFLGFLGMGLILTVVDTMAGRRLQSGDWQGFALWFLPGISLLQVGGSLVEVTSSAAASVVTALLVNRLLLHGYQKRKPAAVRVFLCSVPETGGQTPPL